MNLENFAKMRGLENAHSSANSDLLDHFLSSEKGDEIREKVLTKRLQFDSTPELYNEVERICFLLNCSKRQFLEMAVCDAINKAEDVFLDTFTQATGHDFGVIDSGQDGE